MLQQHWNPNVLLVFSLTFRMSSSGIDPFGFMHNKTVELLSAKVADYGLPPSTDSGKFSMVMFSSFSVRFSSFTVDLKGKVIKS